ncbi:MAG: SH3 domain-containing protein [Proteobacteria bacterium]|nr:SH3 domain-containing protein [Pseudomonadota bacterium]
MKKNSLIAFIVCIACFGLIGASAMAKSMYVRSYQTFLLETPKFKADKMMKLTRGTAVEQIEKKGAWIKVEVNNQEGWLPKLVLSSRPAKRRVSLLSQKVDIASKARRRASSYSSTAAARGLTSARKRASNMEMPDYEALRNIEKREIDEAEAIQFILQ